MVSGRVLSHRRYQRSNRGWIVVMAQKQVTVRLFMDLSECVEAFDYSRSYRREK